MHPIHIAPASSKKGRRGRFAPWCGRRAGFRNCSPRVAIARDCPGRGPTKEEIMQAVRKRGSWTRAALMAAGCLLGCGGGGTIAPPQLPAATDDDAAYWADQLRPRDDTNAALEADAAQRYLDSVPEATRVRWE